MMHSTMKRYFASSAMLLIACCGFTSCSGAEDPKVSEFFELENNAREFELVKFSGAIEEGREKMLAICLGQKGEPKADCDCYKKILNKTSDRVFYYETMTANRRHQERVAAAMDKDMEKLKRLKQEHRAIYTLADRIDDTCGRIPK